MLTNPLYLGNLGDSKDWTMLRSFIMDIIGDVTSEEIFKAEPSTLLIKEDLENALNNIEQVKKQYNNTAKDLEQKITADNANIEMLERTPMPTDEEVAVAQKGVEEHQEKIAKLQANIGGNAIVEALEKQVMDTKRRVLELNTKEFSDFQTKKASPNAGVDSAIEEGNKKLTALAEEKIELKDKIYEATINFNKAKSDYDACVEAREQFVKDLRETRATMNDVDNFIQTECPTCHRPLEESQVAEAKEHFLKVNKEKETAIITKGKENSAMMSKHQAEMEHFAKIKGDLEQELLDLDKNITIQRDAIENLKTKRVATGDDTFTESNELKTLRKKLADFETQLTQAKEEESKQNTLTAEMIEKEKEAIVPFQKVLNDKAYYDRQMQVLNSVRTQRKQRGEDLAEIEQKKECLNLYIYTSLRLLNEHTAKVFGDIRFQLIKENINGGFDAVCKPYIYDIEKGKSTNTIWKSGSKSEKIITGIAIAEHIKSYLGLTELPYLFDEGGEISTDTFSTKFKTDAQIICVKVEDNIFKPVIVNF